MNLALVVLLLALARGIILGRQLGATMPVVLLIAAPTFIVLLLLSQRGRLEGAPSSVSRGGPA